LAEKKEPKKQSFLQFGMAATAEGSKVVPTIKSFSQVKFSHSNEKYLVCRKGSEYDFVEDWGEQLVGKSQPVICIFKVDWEPFQSEDCVRILEASEEWSPGQVRFYGGIL
jgi:hypothetical protein